MYLFLILAVLSALPALITTANTPKTMEEINDGRRIFAKKFNVANMNELEFDDELAKYEWSLISQCLSKPALMADKRYEVVPVMHMKSDEVRYHGEAFLTNPGQTKVGFVDDVMSCKNVEYNIIFVMGPLNKMSVVKNGPPGSKCDEGRVNRNGLCAKKL